ncbi:hypothetical protein PtrM4_120520 [Pyrenophora tritici-repentis]|uniref:Uncharacterized protein n=1 Tax=Pyrenophora tritici-repentis TaxID=45151 RepID=A0A834RU08_9PLEO|nr:hypothetical protein PtrM4_120520 [Pyrenophora tritici-repentis]
MARYRKSTTEGIQAFRHTVLFAIEYAVRADLGNDAGLQYKLLVALDTAASEVANQLALRHPGSQEKFQHWSASRLGFEDNICFLHLAAQLQLIDFVKHHIDKANYSVSRNESGYNFILATLDYSLFAKHQDPQILTIIPKSPSVDLVSFFSKSKLIPTSRSMAHSRPMETFLARFRLGRRIYEGRTAINHAGLR